MNCDYFKLTAVELEIMRVLWSVQRLMSAGDIAERLTGHSRATVAELLRRLAAKAIVQSLTIDRKAMYFYTVNEPMYKAMLLKGLAETLFGGDRAELAHLLLCDMDIKADALCEVRAAVDRAIEVSEFDGRAEETVGEEAGDVRPEAEDNAEPDANTEAEATAVAGEREGELFTGRRRLVWFLSAGFAMPAAARARVPEADFVNAGYG